MTAFRSLAALAVGLLLPLGACAPTVPGPAASPAEIAPAAQVSYGTIVSVRPVIASAAGPGPGGADPRANILVAVGVGGQGLNTGKEVEFIIQEDGAVQPISVVQTNDGSLAPGQRVVLTRGTRTRIARAGA